jgi:hypothetical protein
MRSNTSRPILRFTGVFSLLTLVLVVGGCGGDSGTGTITGKVTYKSEPLVGGQIVFLTDTAGGFSAPIQEDGSYKVEKVPVGKVKVYFQPPATGNPFAMSMKNLPPGMREKVAADIAKKAKPPANAPPEYKLPTARPDIKFPKKYTDAEQSGFVYDVQKGPQSKDFPLD